MASSSAQHFIKNAALIILSFVLLPVDLAVVLLAEARTLVARFSPSRSTRSLTGNENGSSRKTILVTGVSMSKGLALARLFHHRGHRVIGADSQPLSIGRVSRAVDRYYALPQPLPVENDEEGPEAEDPYIETLLAIVKSEGVDLWVSVSDVNAALHDALARDLIEANTPAKAVQFGPREVRLLHDKDAFMTHTSGLGLEVPDTEVVHDGDGLVDFLRRRGALGAGTSQTRTGENRKRYLVKPVGVDDVARFDMPLLPLPEGDEATLRRIASIPFKSVAATASSSSPSPPNNGNKGPRFIVQEFIHGPEFCTHALVVRGRVRAFVSCPSSGLLMHYTALPPDAPLNKLMLEFTQRQARVHGDDFTGHMSFDFLVRSRGQEDGGSNGSRDDVKGGLEDNLQIYPIECNPRVHTAIVLFNDTPELVDQYLSVLDPRFPSTPHPSPERPPLSPRQPPSRYYWAGQDLVEAVLHPTIKLFFAHGTSVSSVAHSAQGFVEHLLHWRDGTFESWDPWPFFWLYHVQWPARFAGYLVRGRWSNLNVSTGKAFKA